MQPIVLINGKKQSQLSIFDRSCQFGDGIFETCLVKNAQVLFFQQHFDRLEKGRKKLQIKPMAEALWLADIKHALSLSQLNDAVLKIILSRGESLRGYNFAKNAMPTRIVIIAKMPKKIPAQYSLSLCQSGYAHNPQLAGIKHCNRLEQVLASAKMPFDDCIMLDAKSKVISTTTANIFAIKADLLSTPDLSECGINGTRRQLILAKAADFGLKVQIKKMSIDEFLSADEVFISNSIIGVRSVVKIKQKLFKIHSITTKIRKIFDV